MSTRTAKTTSNLIYDELKSDIIGGKIEAGKQLRQAELAKRFGSSSIPVREALRQLESEGLVLIQPHRGATVSTFSLTEMLELLDIRLALECRALRLAVPNMTDNDIHLAESVQAEAERSSDPTEWPDLNWRFHATLYAPANRPQLFGLIEQTWSKTAQFMRVQVSMATGKKRPLSEHAAILEACRVGDVEKAVDLMELHISYTQRVLAASGRMNQFQPFADK